MYYNRRSDSQTQAEEGKSSLRKQKKKRVAGGFQKSSKMTKQHVTHTPHTLMLSEEKPQTRTGDLGMV